MASRNGLPMVAGSPPDSTPSAARARLTHGRPPVAASSAGGSSTWRLPGPSASTAPPARSTQLRMNSGMSRAKDSGIAVVIGSLRRDEVLAEQGVVVGLTLEVTLARAHQTLA